MIMFTFPAAGDGVPACLSTEPDCVRRSMSTFEGWAQFVDSRPRPPKRRSAAQLAALDDAARSTYNADRSAFHRGLVLIRHKQLAAAWEQMAHIVNGAHADPGPGIGICVTGDAGFGKTSLVTGFAREYCRAIRTACPQAYNQPRQFVPVCYGAILPGVGLKANMKGLLDFYGEPVRRSDTGADLMRRLFTVMSDCQTKLLILDQAQNLRSGDRRDAEVAAHLKHLMDQSGATIILAGINMTESGPLAPTLGRRKADGDQLAKRFRTIPLRALPEDDPEWADLLTALEGTLRLTAAKPGDLSQRLAGELHARTDGAIGVTINLVKLCANAAIDRGCERITKDLLARTCRSMYETGNQPPRAA